MGPPDRPPRFALTHYTGDVFTFESIGENANGLAGAIFSLDAGGTASSVRLDFYDRTGLGRSPGTDRAHQVAHSPPVVARSRTATLEFRRWELETS